MKAKKAQRGKEPKDVKDVKDVNFKLVLGARNPLVEVPDQAQDIGY